MSASGLEETIQLVGVRREEVLLTLFGAIAERYGAPAEDLESLDHEEEVRFCEALASLPASAEVDAVRRLAAELGEVSRELHEAEASLRARRVSQQFSARLSVLEAALEAGQLRQAAVQLVELERDAAAAELAAGLLDALSVQRSGLEARLLEGLSAAVTMPTEARDVDVLWAAARALGTLPGAVQRVAEAFMATRVAPILSPAGSEPETEAMGPAPRRTAAPSPDLSSSSSMATEADGQGPSAEKRIYGALKKLCSTVSGCAG